MNRVLVIVLFAAMFSLPAAARDTTHYLSISEALNSEAYQGRLDSDIKLYFGKQTHGAVSANHGNFVTNRKTNAFGKSDQKACEWALLSALLVLQERARNEGGNAVVNIASYFKKNEYVSDTQYECHAGAVMAGVALKGDVVTID